MNKITITITDCHDCEFCHHNGLLQNDPKWICQHRNVPKRCKDTIMKYWYEYPILGRVNKEESLLIPDWCPRLQEKNSDK